MNSVDAAETLAHARQIVATFALTELELGLTFLDAAELTRNPQNAHRGIRHAITALRTADKLLARVGPYDPEAVRASREALVNRLRAVAEAQGASLDGAGAPEP
jgi:hypothetical protein